MIVANWFEVKAAEADSVVRMRRPCAGPLSRRPVHWASAKHVYMKMKN